MAAAGRAGPSQPQGAAAAAADGGPSCDCGGPTVLRTSQSARNPGRQFYACGKAMTDESRCKFFQWVDGGAAGGAGGGGGGGGGYGYGGGGTAAAGGGGGYGFGAAPGYGAAAAGGGAATDAAAAGGTGARRV
jgi:hypothetical protein